jgi:hypothetical protein
MARDDDVAARAVLTSQWARFKGGPATRTQLQTVQAIAHLEGGPSYGGDRHNWGGIQCTGPRGEGGACPEGCFASVDRHADGTPYNACFRAYDSAESGAYDLLRTLFAKGLRQTLDTGNAWTVASSMHAKRYFELAPEDYAARIAGRAQIIAKNVGEPVLLRLPVAVAGAGSDDLFWFALVSLATWWAYRHRRRWFDAF